jgi:hypothetical protein
VATRPNADQQAIVAVIAFVALFVVSLLLIGIAASLYYKSISGGSGLGWFFLILIRGQKEIGTIFSVVLIIVSAGLAVLSSRNGTKWLLYIDCTIAIAAIGAAFAIYIMLWDADDERARLLWESAKPEINPDDLVSDIRTFLKCIVGWYGGFLVSQLAIGRRPIDSLTDKIGATLRRFRGVGPVR